jgi:hypothetical protein
LTLEQARLITAPAAAKRQCNCSQLAAAAGVVAT